jgi:hypothetical protein
LSNCFLDVHYIDYVLYGTRSTKFLDVHSVFFRLGLHRVVVVFGHLRQPLVAPSAPTCSW